MKTILIILAILFATEAGAYCTAPAWNDPYARQMYEQCRQMERQNSIQQQILDEQRQQQLQQQQMFQQQQQQYKYYRPYVNPWRR